MKISVIGVPLNLGCDRNGVERAPEVLRRKGLLETIRSHGHLTYDLGNLYVPPVSESDKFRDELNMKYWREVADVNHNLSELVSSAICAGSFPLVIGGDHSIGIGTITGTSDRYDNLGVIWLDAHGDINTDTTSPSGNIHGMSLAAAMGFGNSSVVDIHRAGAKVDPKNVFLVGTRSLDKGEIELIEAENINVYPMETVRGLGMEYIAADIRKKLAENGVRDIHCSLDIDVVDPAYAPGTGTKVEEGVLPEELKVFLGDILSANIVRSIDLVELNPDLDDNDTTANLCLDILDFVASKL